ncbi:hypothetical protein B0H34DRAFT_856929 [Crassisporium funariophilum]|nr:hypothetical protein B0H34DRAFT_856929 [Crassisporium funariophilum]
MPVASSSRYEQPLSPPPMSATPSRSNLRTLSTNSPTVTSGSHQQKLNVITRVAIEGKAKHGQDGASIRMFLKITLPLNSVSPGSTIPLFPEENVKVLTSQVHPLDSNSVPYNFSSTVSPMLHNAARALNLPARSQENYHSAFNLSKSNGTTSSSHSDKPTNGNTTSPIDVQYTGHILVSGYSISFVLPKVFLSRRRNGGFPSDNEEEGFSRTPSTRRRSSVGERNQAHFMAAIDLWVPFLCRPPRSPYLLSIPTPRCLHNHIKLRIFPPVVNNTSASLASLSSMEEESNSWDLTSDPHVTRSSSRPSRSNTYNNFADDESSDSSNTGSADGCAIQGTFPSAERIRVRWAKHLKTLHIPGVEKDGRRRVGVDEVQGEMTCIVRGKGTSSLNADVEGVLMSVEYKGQCKGIWHPGVATLLGLDVGLVAKGSDISWAQGYPSQWEVSGGTGYTGFDSDPAGNRPGLNTRASSFDPNAQIQIHTPGLESDPQSYQTSRTTSTSSMSSLLRAPLPAQNLAEYSFEGSNTTLPSTTLSPMGTMSSISSLPASSTPNLPQPTPIRPPGSPITLHLNMNDLQPPTNNIFTFKISGTVLVTARPSLGRLNSSSTGDKPADPEAIVLPHYTVLAAHSESTSIIVRNEVDGASLEVFHPTGDIHSDAQARKTVLQKGGFTRCGEDGGRVALKFFDTQNMTGHVRPVSRPRTPSNNMATRVPSSAPSPRVPFPARGKREGPTIIPSVQASVTALGHERGMFPEGYAVRICLQTPALTDSEWLEFGMAYGARAGEMPQAVQGKQQTKVHIICASLDGVPVRAETTKAATSDAGGLAVVPFEQLSVKQWVSWGKVYAGTSVGSSLVMDYIVKDTQVDKGKGKERLDLTEMNILLPTFLVSVARFEVVVDVTPGLEISSLRSNFDYHQVLPTGRRLLQYSVEEFAQPYLSLTIRKSTNSPGSYSPYIKWHFLFTWTILLVAFLWMHRLSVETQHLIRTMNVESLVVGPWESVETVTLTTTIYASTTTRRWFGEPTPEPTTASASKVTPVAVPSGDPPIRTKLQTLDVTSAFPSPSSHHHTPDWRETSLDTPTQSILEKYGLIPIEHIFSFSWTDEHADTMKRATDKIVETMEVLWNIFRRVYHYPLNPP